MPDTFRVTPNPGALYAGSAVFIAGAGPDGVCGYITRVTRGQRPYHVKALNGKTYRCAAHHLKWADDDEIPAIRALRDADAAAERDAQSELVLGTVVVIEDRDEFYVVISTPRDGRVNCALLGGNGNRYVKTPTSAVLPVDVTVTLA
jgi:hypothetical protein